ncbi:MAG: STAS domain-containing protein [Chitinophagia bacterium]|nr:STAS domain-containing protein [Chitinophagia bacterium]
MEVKIDTKERFHVVSITAACFTATMAEELSQKLTPYLELDVKSSESPGNIVLKMTAVTALDPEGAQALQLLQQRFYEHNRSFVIMNVTPTESEAWDIVQMEEIERELLDNEFSDN